MRAVTRLGVLSLVLAGLAACGGGDGDGSAAGVAGVAAVGAPVVGGTVSAVCAGGAVTATATTGADGAFELPLPAGVLPCALRVTGGTLGGQALHSFTASGRGTLNITPLTDLVFALALDADPAGWFAAPSGWATLGADVSAAVVALADALEDAGYSLPSGFDPFSVAFTAQPGNPYDDLLEAIAAAVAADGDLDDYADLLASIVAGGGFPAPPSGGGGMAIGKADPLAISASSTLTETAAAVVGSYEVAIYRAVDLADVGAGTFAVAYDGTNITLTLRNADDEVLAGSTVPAADNTCSDGLCVQISDSATVPAGGRRIGLYNFFSANLAYVQGAFLPDGYVYGSATAYGTSNQYLFRNNVLHYGPEIPAVFGTLAGTFIGPSEALTCDPNPITVTVAAGGTVQVQGKSSVSCQAWDISNTWNGQDDYIAPGEGGGARLVLDSLRTGGSADGGGMVLLLPDAEEATLIDQLYTNFEGGSGNITANDPVRQ